MLSVEDLMLACTPTADSPAVPGVPIASIASIAPIAPILPMFAFPPISLTDRDPVPLFGKIIIFLLEFHLDA